MDGEELPEHFQRELDELAEEGISLSEAIGGVFAPECLQAPAPTDRVRHVQDILVEVNRIFGEIQNESSFSPCNTANQLQEPTSSQPSQVAHVQAPLPPLPPLPPVQDSVDDAAPGGVRDVRQQTESAVLQTFSNSLERSKLRHKQRWTRGHEVDEHFEQSSSILKRGSQEVLENKCINCGDKVYGKKRRNKTFHLILCSGLPFKTRGAFYYYCQDKERPPLLEHTVFGMTASAAWKVAEEVKKKAADGAPGYTVDPTSVPRYVHYLMAMDKLKPNTRIADNLSPGEEEVATELLLELLIDKNLPFSICDSRARFPGGLAKLLCYLRPGYKLPRGHKVGGELLDSYYERMVLDMKARLRSILQEGRGTLMFDGSEDINGAPMINILLRVMGSARVQTKTFFLTTVYTEYHTVDADYYIRVAEEAINEFVGFDKIAGIVTDNTGSVKKARETIERKYGRVVASQDQAHVADRLMTDIGEIRWVRDTLDILFKITSDIRRFRKLRARLLVLMKAYNNKLRPAGRAQHGQSAGDDERNGGEVGEDQAAPEGDTTVERVEEIQAVQDNDENDEQESLQEGSEPLEEAFAMCDVRLSSVDVCRLSQDDEDSDPLTDDEGDSGTRNEGPRTNNAPESTAQWPQTRARTMKKVSAVRFASSEKLLDEYISLRPVLLELLNDSHFDSLYTTKNEDERIRRCTSFEDPIRSEEVLLRVRQLHAIFRACRTYLRIFDSETCLSSEVFEATRILEETLTKLPLAFYPDPKEENKEELLAVFNNRKDGPHPGRKQIKIRLLSDLHVAAALLDPYRSPYDEGEYMDAFRRHLDGYLNGIDWGRLDIEERDQQEFIEEMLCKFANVRALWRQQGLLRERSETSALSGSTVRASNRSRKLRSPIAWWTSGSVLRPRDKFERKAVDELIEFAKRTLSVSPTATATERTFSLESRIHNKERSSLGRDKVKKILFCQWNLRVLRHFAMMTESDLNWELQRQVRGITELRAVRSAAESAKAQVESASASVHRDSTDHNKGNAVPTGTDARLQRARVGRASQIPGAVAPERRAGLQNTRQEIPLSQSESLPVGSNITGLARNQQLPVMTSSPMMLPQQLQPAAIPVLSENIAGWLQVVQATMTAYPAHPSQSIHPIQFGGSTNPQTPMNPMSYVFPTANATRNRQSDEENPTDPRDGNNSPTGDPGEGSSKKRRRE